MFIDLDLWPLFDLDLSFTFDFDDLKKLIFF